MNRLRQTLTVAGLTLGILVASPGCSTADPPRAIGAFESIALGVGDQFGCLDELWQRESGWQVQATNPSSGAYGIPQSLPAEKMASAGTDWRTNPYTQIRWGIDYIKARYGGPCNALANQKAYGYY